MHRLVRRGFTLIELLVVIAIIALLIGILLPSLGAARAISRATVCAANLRSVGQAMAIYLANSDGVIPPSYVYPKADGTWDPNNQDPGNPYGYQHWSYYLLGELPSAKAFTCPDFDHGGLPRTNPGKDGRNWLDGEVDGNGQTGPSSSSKQDRQAPWMAFTMNAAICPRNKFTNAMFPSAQRLNQFVKVTSLPSDIIMATEFTNIPSSVSVQEVNGYLSKSHRPVTPFDHLGTGNNPYGSASSGFWYGQASNNFGLIPLDQFNQGTPLVNHDDYDLTVNAVGRHHPGSSFHAGQNLGGTANFLYVDSHIERKPVYDTMRDAEWGRTFWSVTGDNSVLKPINN